jgi:hypothetical protein
MKNTLTLIIFKYLAPINTFQLFHDAQNEIYKQKHGKI